MSKRVAHPKKKLSLPFEGLISLKRFTHMDNPEYVYVFVRQDLSNEQQLVQSAHVTLVLGNKLKHDVSQLYFTVIGVPQLVDFTKVMADLNAHGTKYEAFYEPDQGNTLTAIATHPIPKDKRGKLKDYKLLRFNK
jgi:hypothetical protein